MKLYAHWDGGQPFTKVLKLDGDNTVAELRTQCWETLAARHPELAGGGPGALHLLGPDRRPLPLNSRLDDVLCTGDDVFFLVVDSARGASPAHSAPPAATTSNGLNDSASPASGSSGLTPPATSASSGAASTAGVAASAAASSLQPPTTPAAPQPSTPEGSGPHIRATEEPAAPLTRSPPQGPADTLKRPGDRTTAAASSPQPEPAAPEPGAAGGRPARGAAAAAPPPDEALVPVVRALWLRAEELAKQLHYRGAGDILQQALLLVPDAASSPTHIATLVRLARLWLSAGNPAAAVQWALRAAELRPNDPGVLELAGDCLRDGGRPREAAAQYQSALEVLQEEAGEEEGEGQAASTTGRGDRAASRSGEGGSGGPAGGSSEAALLLRLRVSLAGCLAAIPGSITPPYNNQDLAASLVMSVLEQDPGHWEALRLYARIALERGLVEDALRVALRLVVGQPKHSGAKALLAECLKDEAGCRKLYVELGLPVVVPDAEGVADAAAAGRGAGSSKSGGDSSTAAALAFVATAVKDFGKVDTCITLLQRAVQLDPTHASYSLNLVHALELRQELQEVVVTGERYCRRCGTKGLAGRPLKDVEALLSALPQLRDPLQLTWYTAGPLWGSTPQPHPQPEHQSLAQPGASAGEAPSGGSRQGPGNGGAEGSGAASGVAPAKVTYDSDQLDALALLFTLAKVLFVGGALSAAAQLCALVDPLRRASAVELHTTLIRNEAAYFGCVAQLLRDHPPPPATPPGGGGGPAPLYLCGDSHCLSAAWRIVTLRGEQRLLRPLLVTGCKVWHLRPASEFYPKKQFETTTRMLPDGAQVVLVLGEIDCREGLLLAVQKGKYESVAEGIDATVAIYLEVVRELVVGRRMEVFLHPVPPVLNETRAVVAPFTAALRTAVAAAREADPQLRLLLHFLDFFDQLLVPAGGNATAAAAARGSAAAPAAGPASPGETERTGSCADVSATDVAGAEAGGGESQAPVVATTQAATTSVATGGGGDGGAGRSSEGVHKDAEVTAAAATGAGGGVPGPGGWSLRPDLAFDGTHLAPAYVPLLDAALAQVQ